MSRVKRAIKFIKVSFFSYNQKESLLYKFAYYLLLNKFCYNFALFLFKFTKLNNLLESSHTPEKFLESFYLNEKDLEKKIINFKRKKILKKHYYKKTSILIKNGFVPFSKEIQLDKKIINSFKKDLLKLRAYNSHVPLASNLKKMKIDKSTNYFSFDPSEPKLLKYYKFILNNSKLKKILKDYFDFKPKLYSINTMLTTSHINKNSVTDLHRDYDDYDFLSLFVYWTDVKKNNGSTIFVKNSIVNTRNKKKIYLEGKQGSCYLCDTFALHSGNKKIKKDRIVTWFRFGKRSNLVHFADKGYLFNSLYDKCFR